MGPKSYRCISVTKSTVALCSALCTIDIIHLMSVDIPYHLRLLAQPAESIVRDVTVYTGQFVALQMYQTFIQVGIMILVVMKSACGGLVLNRITSFPVFMYGARVLCLCKWAYVWVGVCIHKER